MRTQWLIISALVFSLVTAVFAVINVEPVEVNYLFGTASLPLILVILAATVLGGVTTGLFGIVRQYRLQRHIRALEKQLQERPAGAASQPSGNGPAAPEPADSEDVTELRRSRIE